MAVPNTTYRAFVEKLGSTAPAEFIGNEGELFWDPNTGSLRISDGSTPGGIAVTGVTTVAPGPIALDLIPDGDGVYDLGSPTNQWKDLYLTNNTMYLGGTSVAVDSGSLAVDGESLAKTSEVKTEANQRLLVNTDRRVYGDYAPATTNPNNNAGGWYYRTANNSVLRWNFYTPKPNSDGSAGELGSLAAGWCIFTPWATDSAFPFFQFYTTPKLGGGNTAAWYRSKVTYTRPDETLVAGTPLLLYFGTDPVDVFPGVPRKELTFDAGGSEGPRDSDERIFSSYLGHTTGAPDGYMDFSTTQVGFQYGTDKYQYGLYATPEAAGVTTTTIVDGKTFSIVNGIIVDIT